MFAEQTRRHRLAVGVSNLKKNGPELSGLGMPVPFGDIMELIFVADLLTGAHPSMPAVSSMAEGQYQRVGLASHGHDSCPSLLTLVNDILPDSLGKLIQDTTG